MKNITLKILTISSLLAFAAMVLPNNVFAQRSGVEIWAQTCGNCHNAQPNNRYTADQWESIMTHMKITARLTDEEADAVLAFLKGGARKVADAEVAPASDQMLASAAEGDEVLQSLLSGGDIPDTFKSLCAPCHGKKGKGDGIAAAALNPKPANFTDKKFQESRTDEQLTKSLKEGKGIMPAFGGQLSDVQIANMVKYLRSLKKN